jgi:hypothetical protein
MSILKIQTLFVEYIYEIETKQRLNEDKSI